tara:strand:- start:1208 stop:1405 length:198 start_codon:yes stop_codon:yes gene_type:complete
MTEGLDIYRTAELMRGEHGKEAHSKALDNAEAFGKRSMPEAVATWKRVASAILDLERVSSDTEVH